MSPIDSNAGGTTVVIFGASGDLTRRKLIPALYNNFKKKRLPAGLQIVGFARRDCSDDQFRDLLGTGVKEYGTAFDPSAGYGIRIPFGQHEPLLYRGLSRHRLAGRL